MLFLVKVVSLFLVLNSAVGMPIDILELEGTNFKIEDENFNTTSSSPDTLFSAGTQYGFDVSTTITASSASCFVSSGYVFTVPRVSLNSNNINNIMYSVFIFKIITHRATNRVER